MNNRRTKIISYLLTASFLLSFWICVEGCQAEVEIDFETKHLTSHNIRFENVEEDSCSIQTAPLAFYSNQESFVPADSKLPNRVRKQFFKQNFACVLSRRTGKTFLKTSIQILRQLRI